jgi:hypothetical protein
MVPKPVSHPMLMPSLSCRPRGVFAERTRTAAVGTRERRGDALADPVLGARHPEDRLVVRVDIDESGRHRAPGRVDHPGGAVPRNGGTGNGDDPVTPDRDVGANGRGTGAVEHHATGDQEIIGRRLLLHEQQGRHHERGHRGAPWVPAFEASQRRRASSASGGTAAPASSAGTSSMRGFSDRMIVRAPSRRG